MCACRVGKVVFVFGAGEGCDGVVWDSVVWHGVVLNCGFWLSLCVHGVGEGCDGIVVGNGRVLPSGVRLVFVRKPTCSHICRLGVVWIVCSLLEHYSLGLSCLFSP